MFRTVFIKPDHKLSQMHVMRGKTLWQHYKSEGNIVHKMSWNCLPSKVIFSHDDYNVLCLS